MSGIENIAVVGAGTMGGGIAISAIRHGHTVTLIDNAQEMLSQAAGRTEAYLSRQVDKGRMTADESSEANARLGLSTDIASAENADLVIEAVFEDLQVKRNVFERLEQLTSPQCILATNTSALKVSDIAETVQTRERLCGIHYFSPAEVNPVVELVSSVATTSQTISAAREFLARCGKTAIVCKDHSGFALNRFFCPYTNEAARCIDDGLGSPAQIDVVARDIFGVPVGPFYVMNIVKPRINLAAVRNLAHLGPFYAPAESLTKVGDADDAWDIDADPAPLSKHEVDVVALRLQGAIYRAVNEEIEEGVASPDDIDIGACRAFAFAVGPVQMMREAGDDKVSQAIATVERG